MCSSSFFIVIKFFLLQLPSKQVFKRNWKPLPHSLIYELLMTQCGEKAWFISLLHVIPSKTTARMIKNMVTVRTFQETMGSDISSPRKLKTVCHKDWCLFCSSSAYISQTCLRQILSHQYADDWILATRSCSFEETEEVLTTNLEYLGRYLSLENAASNQTPVKQK